MIVLTPSYILSNPPIPPEHTKIGFDNLVRDSTITANTTAAGSYLNALKNDLTYEWWGPTAVPAVLTIDFGDIKTFNYIGIAVHDLGSNGNQISLNKSNDGLNYEFIEDSQFFVQDDAPLMVVFEETQARYVQVTISSGTIPKMSVLYIGKTLDMQRPVRWLGHTPGRFARTFEKRGTVSRGGQRLGTSVIRQEIAASFDVMNISQYWTRNVFEEFILSAVKYGYFLAWRPTDYPAEVLFGWTDEAIVPYNSQRSTSGLMAVSWNMVATGNWEGGVYPW